ncbi:hypothetical protein OAU00_03070 [Saprospiraceae bacterium]|nr:hypothetical protein [Saprospiraceae bacterium]MDC3220048.1 hypothetical protein [Saprospiraceae bacterium]
MNKYLKFFFVWTGLFLIVTTFLLIVIASVFEDQISERLVNEVNKQLKTELRVGEFNLSLISGFPDASANLHDVELDDALSGMLLEAQSLSFQFGLFSLFGSNIRIHSIVIEDGSFYIKKDKKGRTNYDIIKKTSTFTEEGNENEVRLSLDEARFNRVEVIYVDQTVMQYTKFHLNNAVASGNFSANKFSLFSFADIHFHFFQSGEEQFLVDEEIIYDAKVDVDLTSGKYEFDDVTVGISSNVFNVDGLIERIEGGYNYDLKIKSDDGSLSSVVALMPPENKKAIEDFDSKGTFFFETIVKGSKTVNTNPAVTMKFGLEGGEINSEKLGSSLKDVSFSAIFTNGKKKNNENSFFEISDFKGYFNRELVEGELRVSNFDDPLIDFNLNGTIPIESVYGMLNIPIISDGDGDIEMKKLRIKGNLKDIVSPYGIGRVTTSGELEFYNASMTINDEDITIDKGLLKFNDNSIQVEGLAFEGPGTEIKLEGTFLNFLPVLFADSLNSKHAELKFNASLDATKIDFDELLKVTEIPVDENIQNIKAASGVDTKEIAKTQARERITNFLKGKFAANIEEFNFREIDGEEFQGVLEFDNNEMSVKGKVKMMEGRMLVDGKTFFEGKPHMEAKLTCEQINIKEFLKQAENFGQEVLTYNNLKGKLNAKFFIESFWSSDGTFLTDKLHILGDVGLSNGELIGLKILYDFSDYVKIEDLRRIKFTNIHNYMEVKKSKIFMPAMFIQSNALNLAVSGTHTFENKIDYNIKVNAGQVIFAKFKKHNSNLRPQKAKKNGWFNLYYRIYGQMETFTYESDKRRVRQQLDASGTRKRKIQKELIKHFGNIVSIEEPTDWRDVIPDKKDDNEDVEFIDFDGIESEGSN